MRDGRVFPALHLGVLTQRTPQREGPEHPPKPSIRIQGTSDVLPVNSERPRLANSGKLAGEAPFRASDPA